MDGVVPAQNKISSNKLSTSCYTEKLFSLSSHKNNDRNCEKMCSSYDPSYRRRSFNSNLHSIDETESLDFQHSRERELCTSNVYPEKRQSDPLLHCAFTNKRFDIELNSHKHFSMYDKVLDTFSHLQHHSVDDAKKCTYPIPKIKIRISDECGNRIDNSSDSQSDSDDDDDCWNFGATINRNGYESHVDDAFNIIRNEEIIRPTVNKCGKCGHKSLKTQFSTTFS